MQAEGQKQAKVLVAEGEAQAIKLVNESADLYFKGNAQHTSPITGGRKISYQ